MNIRWLGVAVLAVGVGACSTQVPPPPTPEPEPEEVGPTAPAEDLKALADGNNAFAVDLYKKLAETEKGNIVFSPYSVRTALAMTYAGARGKTAEEMRKVLHFTLPDERLHPAFGATSHQFKGGKDKQYELNVANALWGQKGLPFRPEFLELTNRNYAGGFRELGFAADPDAARNTINRWIEEKTQDKIKELLKKEDIDNGVLLVLTNAIYFKGGWVQPFVKEWSRDDDFETQLGEKMKVPLMSVGGRFRYHSSHDFELVELPYRGERMSMVLVLPKKRCGLAEMEKGLTAEKLHESIAKLSDHDGLVTLPKFKTNCRFELKDPLKVLGMPSAFEGDADFSGISTSRLKIRTVIHGGDIVVEEQGTEAAAATVVVMDRSERPSFKFLANHPFLYLILDKETGSILFLGRFTTPG